MGYSVIARVRIRVWNVSARSLHGIWVSELIRIVYSTEKTPSDDGFGPGNNVREVDISFTVENNGQTVFLVDDLEDKVESDLKKSEVLADDNEVESLIRSSANANDEVDKIGDDDNESEQVPIRKSVREDCQDISGYDMEGFGYNG